MNNIRKFFFILPITVLCNILCSCNSKNNSIDYNPETNWDKYVGNYSNITCRNTTDIIKGDSILFSGVRNGHLWYVAYSQRTKEKIFEWEDQIAIDTMNYKIDRGYGVYENARIKNIIPSFYRKTNDGSIVSVCLYVTGGTLPISYVTSFTKQNESVHIVGKYYRDWYNNSIVLFEYGADDEGIYSILVNSFFKVANIEGNQLFSFSPYTGPPHIGMLIGTLFSYAILISNEEAILCVDNYIFKWNYSNASAVWTTECKAPFDIPTDAKPKCTSTLLDKSTDVWKYKVNMVYYDGTKKEFTFTININTGEYKASV